MIDITRYTPERESWDIPTGMRDDVDEDFFEFSCTIEWIQILEYIRDEEDDLIFPYRLRFAHTDWDTWGKESFG